MSDVKFEKKKIYFRSASATTVQQPVAAVNAAAFLRAKSLQDAEKLRSSRTASIIALEQLVQCGICLEKLSQPKMLPCQHTFCMNCLKELLLTTASKNIPINTTSPTKEEINLVISRSENEIHCPTCKIPAKFGKGFEGLQKLPINVYMDSLLSVLENYGNNDLVPELAIVNQTAVEVKCSNCQTVCDFMEENCVHCKQVFCKVCWLEHLSSLKNSLSTLIEHLEESENRLEERLEDFKKRCEKCGENIKLVTGEKILEIKAMEETNIKELNSIKEQEESIAKELRERRARVRKEIKEISFELIPNDKQKVDTFLIFHRATSTLLDDISHLGETRLLFDPKTSKIKQIATFINEDNKDNRNSIFSAVKNPFESVQAMCTYYLTKSLSPKLVWTKCPRPAGVSIPPWAQHLLYIAATDRKVVLIMDRRISKVIGKLFAPEMLYPHGIAFSAKKSEIYVSDKWKHCVHVFSSGGDYLRTLCTLGSRAGELRSPEGIACTPRNELVVCDVGNDRVVVINPDNGQLVQTIGVKNNCTEFQAPTGVTVYKDTIIVADHGNNRIKTYSMDGKKLSEFGSLGSNRGQFRTIEVVACDAMGFILVGDAGNARIQVFQPDGTLVRVIGKYGEAPGKFAWISGLTVTPEMEIIVTDYKNRRLQIF